MDNHLCFNPFNILNIEYRWKIDISRLSKAFVLAQRECHPDTKSSDIERSIKISNSYAIIKNDIRRGYALIDIFSWGDIKNPNMKEILLLQSSDNIENLWNESFSKLEIYFSEKNKEQFMMEFAKFIYIDKIRSRIYDSINE